MRFLLTILLLFTALPVLAKGEDNKPLPADPPLAPGLTMKDDITIAAPVNLLEDIPATANDGLVNALVEIPTGSNAKWEVKPDGVMHWDTKDGKPRIVKYLSYVGNYGMVPSTRQGDGDPVDILILAPAYPRGSVVPVRLIGALRFTDKGEQDDKLLAVAPGTPLGDVTSLEELKREFPGVTDIVQIWFDHYKGEGNAMEFKGEASAGEASVLLQACQARFEEFVAERKKP